MNIVTYDYTSPEYPDQLRQIASPPKKIYALGAISALAMPMVSVVGSRKVTPYGQEVTTMLCTQLTEQGVAVVSGLAFGVDAVAHKAAVKARGVTIAVMPGGLDSVYPASHRQLAKEILLQGGLLLSEHPVGTRVFKQHFVARNRIVAGLSLGLLVTEAASKSGTLHTAQFALEQGKPVMAVPGNITSPMSVGTNQLLQTGAVLVSSCQDIMDAIGLSNYTNPQFAPSAENPQEDILITLLQQGISEGSTLQLQSRLAPDVFNQTLTMLELTGKIKPGGANHWILVTHA